MSTPWRCSRPPARNLACGTGTPRTYVLKVAESGAVSRLGVRYPGDISLVDLEHANFLSALRWLHEQDRLADGLALCQALSGFWLGQGLLREGADWLGVFLAQPARVSPHAAAEGWYACGRLNEYARETSTAPARPIRPQPGDEHRARRRRRRIPGSRRLGRRRPAPHRLRRCTGPLPGVSGGERGATTAPPRPHTPCSVSVAPPTSSVTFRAPGTGWSRPSRSSAGSAIAGGCLGCSRER